MSLVFHPAGSALPEGALALENTADVLAQHDAIAAHRTVLLHFPKWTDGRAYSQATLLRTRLGYRGDIRAVGDVVVDMAPLLQRCGFSSAVLREGQSQAAAERALGFFDGHYQGDADGGAPVFAAAAR